MKQGIIVSESIVSETIKEALLVKLIVSETIKEALLVKEKLITLTNVPKRSKRKLQLKLAHI